VYVGDCGPDARVRLDGLARFLQDEAGDDAADAGDPGGPGWVVRRTVVEVAQRPVLREDLEVATFCGGWGRRWAERRTSITGSAGGRVEAASLWVHVDPATGRPRSLPPEFHDAYGEAAGGREVSARQRHALEVPVGAASAPWLVRAVDLDILGHVNNAVGWAVLEEALELAGARDVSVGLRAEVEYRRSLELVDDVALLWVGGGPGTTASDGIVLRCWLVTREAAARVIAGDGGTLAADEVFVTGVAAPVVR
jgi:acyl-ACP thioesterase